MDVKRVMEDEERPDLPLNGSKCKINAQPDFAVTNPVLRKFYFVPVENSLLLGAPLFPGKGLDDTWADRCADLAKAKFKLSAISSRML